jgi:hypothetical protein
MTNAYRGPSFVFRQTRIIGLLVGTIAS